MVLTCPEQYIGHFLIPIFFLLVDSPVRVKSLLKTLFSHAPFLFQPLKFCMECPCSPFTQCAYTYDKTVCVYAAMWQVQLAPYNFQHLKRIAISTFGGFTFFGFVLFFQGTKQTPKNNKSHLNFFPTTWSEKKRMQKNKWQSEAL